MFRAAHWGLGVGLDRHCASADSTSNCRQRLENDTRQSGTVRVATTTSTAPTRVLATEAKLMRVDSTGRVLVGYPAREGNELAIRGNPRLLFHILRFTSDGKLDLSVSLPTDNIPHNAIFLDAHDHLLVVANGLLQMLTGDDEMPVQQRTWRVITSCSWPAEGCRVEQSPTRQQLFITKCPESNPFCEIPGLTVYDTSLREPQSTKTCTRRGGRTTDKFGYLSGWDKGYYTRRYPLCGADTPQDLPVHDAVCAVLNDSLFVVRSGKDERLLAVITEQGDTKFQLHLPKHDTPASNIDYVKGDAVGKSLCYCT